MDQLSTALWHCLPLQWTIVQASLPTYCRCQRRQCLQGNADDRALEHLSLQHCMLHLQEAGALQDSLRHNSHLRMLNLRGARLGVDSPSHNANLKSCIAAVAAHESCGDAVEIVRQTAEELQVMKRNRVLIDIEMTHNNAMAEHRLGLNRAKFWQLKQDRIAEWMTALELTKNNHSCLFTMLRETPCCSERNGWCIITY